MCNFGITADAQDGEVSSVESEIDCSFVWIKSSVGKKTLY